MPPARHLAASESVDSLPTVADSGSYFEAQAQIASSIGMSASVIKQMRTGAYTYDQIESLLAQRRHAIDTIRRTKNPSTASVPPTPQSPTRNGDNRDSVIASVGTTAASSPVAILQKLNVAALPMPPAGTPYNTPAGSLASTPNATTSAATTEPPQKDQVGQKEICTYQVCHTCRPIFQDRLHMSFEPALNNEVPALDEGEMMTLPVQDAGIVSNLGLRRRPLPSPLRRSEESMDITMHQRDGNGYESFGHDTSSDWTPTTTSSEADSDLSGNFDLSPCPGPGICPVWISSEGCAYELGFDDGKREINHGYSREERRLAEGLGIAGTDLPPSQMPGSLTSTPDRSTASNGSSISLPNPPTTPLTAVTLSSSPSRSLPDRSSPASNKSSSSSTGSEVEVAGGVALTEEAVGSGTPDIAVQ